MSNESAQTFGVVLEVNVTMLGKDLQYALMQVMEMPKVYTRGEFLRNVSLYERTFKGVSFEELQALPVKNFDYVALVSEPAAKRDDRVLVDIKRTYWESVNQVVSGSAVFDKGKRNRLLRNLQGAAVFGTNQ